MFRKLLIANRGEIACRIIKTARRLGVQTAAVYSQADANARHVRLANEAVMIGPAPARESYLDIERVLDAVAKTGAQAVHPGYGFLSENEDFAEACAHAGVIFVGPPAAAIRAMGNKSVAKALMEKAGVPLVPGYHGDDQDVASLKAEAKKIGYPVLIKAAAGGGGKGMRIVEKAADFADALASCQRESASSFGDDRVLIEKYLQRPRHIEVQVFADNQGHCLHLFDRDCSVQRRHQKVLEEAPAPGLTNERRRQMGEAAVAAAHAVGYCGAGTVEFIVEPNGQFYFMEMNTRLQVEHPVTEMITNLDLVEWQLRVAAAEPLPLTQEQLTIRGHAIEARIYAEDPAKGFLPSTGKLLHLTAPDESPHVRIDTGVELGDEITPYYDPMIAKLIVWDTDREQARQRLLQALAQYRVAGVANNVEFLARIAACSAFANADLDTGLIERERAFLFPSEVVPLDAYLLAALATLLRENQRARVQAQQGGDRCSPWHWRDGWRLNGIAQRQLKFRHGDIEQAITVSYDDGTYRLGVGDTVVRARGKLGTDAALRAELDGVRLDATVVMAADKHYVFLRGHAHQLIAVEPLVYHHDDNRPDGELLAPMPGRVVALLAKPGARVDKGAPLLVLEAMKMEHTLAAPAAGTVRGFRFAVGAQVVEGAELVDFEKELMSR
ncbi:MAG: acetyl/propionyl/methylcrotonyl-CoA carboxylase subunit alpha [Gammaproteobacteria bacterium]|nr:acetyl/propionyl/methylcrotonyl-CoA carboxylase subunit alpha [Gammaproteobacteria bacterium]